MKFRKMSLAVLRIKSEHNGFYEGVLFQNQATNKAVKKVLSRWMQCLAKDKGITIESFKELFSQLHEIVFPIKIEFCYGTSSFHMVIVDNEGKEYYMSKECILDYNNVETYIIGRRNSLLEQLVDREFQYKISKDKTIVLTRTLAMRLKADGTNDDIVVDFCYDSQKYITEATLKSFVSNNEIKMQYPTVRSEIDKKVVEFLFSISEGKFYYYNVVPILKWMLLAIPMETVSLFIRAEVEGEICSEIDIRNGIVERYMRTEIISEGEIRKIELIFAKALDEFLEEHN